MLMLGKGGFPGYAVVVVWNVPGISGHNAEADITGGQRLLRLSHACYRPVGERETRGKLLRRLGVK